MSVTNRENASRGETPDRDGQITSASDNAQSQMADGPAGGAPTDPAAAAVPAPPVAQAPAEDRERSSTGDSPVTETPPDVPPVAEAVNAEAAESGEQESEPSVPLPEVEAQRALRQELLRERLHARLDRSRRLPPGLRQRLAAHLAQAEAASDGREAPTIRLSDAIAWLEESLPEHVALAPDDAARPEHPRGEAFFRDDAGGLSDGEAEEIARRQVARAGFGRK